MRSINKVSFKAAGASGVKIGYENIEDNQSLGHTEKDYKQGPHIDFSKALDALKPHLLFVTEFMEAAKFKKFPTLAEDDVIGKDFRVCGVTIKGKGEKEGIIITGYRTLSTGLGHVINTPFIRIENEGDTAYKFTAELLEAVEAVKKEANEYILGKFGVVQAKMEFPGEPEVPAAQGE